MHKHAFLEGLCGCFLDGSGHTLTTLFFFRSIFIPSVLVLHHEINDLPFGLKWGCFFVVCMFVSVCLYSWECQCMCKCSFTYVFGCLCLCMCVYRVCIFVLTRACALSTAVAWGSHGRVLFCPFWHKALCYKLLTLPTYLLSSLLFISLCPLYSTPSTTSTHKHLKGELNLCFLSQSHVWGRKTGGERPADWSLTHCYCLVTLPAHQRADSKHLT